MTPRNPLGQMAQRKEAPDDNWIVDYCIRAQPTTMTLLDAAQLAGRCQREGRVPYSIFRDYGFEPYPGDTASDAQIKDYAKGVYRAIRKLAADTGNSSTHVMVNCEQGHQPARIKMYTELMRLSASDPGGPVGIVFLNAAVGTIQTGFWGQPNDFERPDMLEFLKTLDQYRSVRLPSGSYAFILGIHNYTSQYPAIAVNAGEYRESLAIYRDVPKTPENPSGKVHTGQYRPPTWDGMEAIEIDWNKAQDHLGREKQGIYRALGWEWNAATRKWLATGKTLRRSDGSPVEPPWMIGTEGFIDDVGGVPIVAPHIEGNNGRPQGFHTLQKTWEGDWFVGDAYGMTLGRIENWAWRKVYQGDGYTIGFNSYCIGNTGISATFNKTRNNTPNNEYFNYARLVRYEMPDHFFAAPVSVPTPTPDPPIPIDLGEAVVVTIQAGVERWVIRGEPASTSAAVGYLKTGEVVKLYPASVVVNGGYNWHVVKRLGTPNGEATQGWSAYPIPLVQPPPPPPKPEPERKTRSWRIDVTATDEEMVQASVIGLILVDAFSKLAAMPELQKLTGRISIHDMSQEGVNL